MPRHVGSAHPASLRSAPAFDLVTWRPAWVIGRTPDLAWLIGGALVAYAFLAAHVVLGVPAVVLYVLWILAIDGPHVFATVSRTYLDPTERAARAALLRWSLGFFALGPTAVLVSILAGTRLPYDAFLAGCSLWAYWHVVRQHYGIMVLYKRKARDTAPADDRVDATFLYVGLLAPAVAFALQSPRTLLMVGLDAPPPWAHGVAVVAWSAVAAALLVLALRQIVRVVGGAALNLAKLLFLTAAVPVSLVLFSPAVAARSEFEAVFPVVTSFHDVQYLAIVWFFHRNRRDGAAGPRRPPAPFTASLATFFGAGVAFTLCYRTLLGCAFSAWPGCGIGAEHVALPAGLTLSDPGVGFLWGFALHHYYLDQKIWRVSRDPQLGRDLQLDRAA